MGAFYPRFGEIARKNQGASQVVDFTPLSFFLQIGAPRHIFE
jgi:hypothetical protein